MEAHEFIFHITGDDLDAALAILRGKQIETEDKLEPAVSTLRGSERTEHEPRRYLEVKIKAPSAEMARTRVSRHLPSYEVTLVS